MLKLLKKEKKKRLEQLSWCNRVCRWHRLAWRFVSPGPWELGPQEFSIWAVEMSERKWLARDTDLALCQSPVAWMGSHRYQTQLASGHKVGHGKTLAAWSSSGPHLLAHSEATCFPSFCSVTDSRAWGYEREFKMASTQWFAGIYLVAPFLRSSLELLDVSWITLSGKSIQKVAYSNWGFLKPS